MGAFGAFPPSAASRARARGAADVVSRGTPSHEPTAGDTLAIVGCSHGVAPLRAESGRGRPFSPTFNSRPRPGLAER